MCRCCWNVATYEWNVHNGKIEIISWNVATYKWKVHNGKIEIEWKVHNGKIKIISFV